LHSSSGPILGRPLCGRSSDGDDVTHPDRGLGSRHRTVRGTPVPGDSPTVPSRTRFAERGNCRCCRPLRGNALSRVVTATGVSALIPIGIVFVVGFGFGWLYERTGSLVAPIVAHIGYNVLIYASGLILTRHV
jgi:hypothetical protein